MSTRGAFVTVAHSVACWFEAAERALGPVDVLVVELQPEAPPDGGPAQIFDPTA